MLVTILTLSLRKRNAAHIAERTADLILATVECSRAVQKVAAGLSLVCKQAVILRETHLLLTPVRGCQLFNRGNAQFRLQRLHFYF